MAFLLSPPHGCGAVRQRPAALVVGSSWCGVAAPLVRHPPTPVSRIRTCKARLAWPVTCQRREVDADSSPTDDDASPSGDGVPDLRALLSRKRKELQLIEEQLRHQELTQVGVGAGELGDGAEDPVRAPLFRETDMVRVSAAQT